MWQRIVSFFMTIYTFILSLFGLSVKSETVKIKLEGNPTTGYDWECAVEDTSIAVCTEEKYTASAGVSAGGTFTFTFKGIAEGVTTVTFTYGRPFEPTLEKTTRVYLLTVDEELNISAKEIANGSQTVITLPGHADEGIFWTYTVDDEDIALLTAIKLVPTLSGTTQTYYSMEFTFTAQRAGFTTVTFTSYDVDDFLPSVSRSFLLTVDNALRITCEEI